MIDLEPVQCGIGNLGCHRRFTRDIGEIAHAAQQPSGDAWRAPRALAISLAPSWAMPRSSNARRTGDNQFKLVIGIEIQPNRDAEPVA